MIDESRFKHLSVRDLDARIATNRERQSVLGKPKTKGEKRTLKLLQDDCAELIAERNRREDMQHNEWLEGLPF